MGFKIKDVSNQLEVPVSTVRYWQTMFADLVNPERTDGGQRRYSSKDIETFGKIKELVYGRKMQIERARKILRQGGGGEAGIDWTDKSILITGGTGSFGKHFCRTMLKKYHPKVIRIFSRDELKQHEMRIEFGDDERLRFFIGDVRDGDRLRRAMEGVDMVVHAAALKQVPACEYNPFEAVKTNIHGARNVIDAAIDTRVKKVIALSTDKAVNPVNLYGATKLCSDKLFTQGNAYSATKGTRFSCVRYGNVIGSRGSVIPLFLKQKESGVLTVTDPRMTRFWITLDEAVELVIKGFTYMEGGEIFVPRIPSMLITDLAEAIDPDCELKVIGIRPGEKLHEALTGEDEGRNTISYKGMYVILPNYSWWERENYKEATKLPENFVYTSDQNDSWMSVEQLRRIVYGEQTPAVRELPREREVAVAG
ncbi:MAG: UDP-N-acetylglucosamine 4,6-dehydratase (inverting) [Proteobacteria bacterium]|nr:UDP-N-acetylglucosamine 4,6-dehydratase (inverting) [Pseudomonadota bacterium]MBU1687952.1 UDP-N-acetylglucosamine 4,6-dehydratase (inverting) [Pseudomonadota bacterium]